MDHRKEDKRRRMFPWMCSTQLQLWLWGRARGQPGLCRAECTGGCSHHCGGKSHWWKKREHNKSLSFRHQSYSSTCGGVRSEGVWAQVMQKSFSHIFCEVGQTTEETEPRGKANLLNIMHQCLSWQDIERNLQKSSFILPESCNWESVKWEQGK